MHSLSRADIDGYLARLVAKRIPGYEDFQNLSPDCFSSHIHPTDDNRDFRRPASRTTVEPFLRGEKSTASAIAFLQAAEKDSVNFPVRGIYTAERAARRNSP